MAGPTRLAALALLPLFWPLALPLGELLCHPSGAPVLTAGLHGHCDDLPRIPGGKAPNGGATCRWRVSSYGDLRWEVAATLYGHTDSICSVEFSADGNAIATGSADGTARVWRMTWDLNLTDIFGEDSDGDGGGEAAEVPEPERWDPEATLGRAGGAAVRDVAWSPDGAKVVVLGVGGAAQIWGPPAALQPDSTAAAEGGSADLPRFVGCFDETQLVHKTYYGNEAAVRFEVMSRHARKDERLYVAMARHAIGLGHGFTAGKLVGSPMYGRVACGSRCSDRRADWCGCANEDTWGHPNPDCPSGSKIYAVYAVGPEAPVRPPPAMGGGEPHSSTANTSWVLLSDLSGHGDAAWATTWPSSGAAEILEGAPDRTACIVLPEGARSGVELRSCADSAGAGNDEPRAHGTETLTSTDARSATIWQTADTSPPSPWVLAANLEAPAHLVTSARWSPDGLRVMTGGNDGVVRIFQLGGPDVHGSRRSRWDVVASHKAHARAVWAIAWAPDSGRVVSGSQDGELIIWRPKVKDPIAWERALTLDVFPGDAPSDINGSLYSTVERARNKGYPWDFVARLSNGSNMDWISSWSVAIVAEWSPDGLSILTGCRDGTVRVWQESIADSQLWQVVSTIRAHNGTVWAVGWSPDSARFVTGGLDGKARVWRLLGGAPAPSGNVGEERSNTTCLFVKYPGTMCPDMGLDMLEDYRGSVQDCKRQCCSMGEACAGFEAVASSSAVPGGCSFRASVMEEPVRWVGAGTRDCYKQVRASEGPFDLRYPQAPHRPE